MNTNHTPGPWAVVDGYYPCFREVSGASFKISAVMSASDLTEDDYMRRSADLKLIAAAPLLLDALRGVMAIVSESRGVSGYHLNGEVAEWDYFAEIGAVQAAIAAATN